MKTKKDEDKAFILRRLAIPLDNYGNIEFSLSLPLSAQIITDSLDDTWIYYEIEESLLGQKSLKSSRIFRLIKIPRKDNQTKPFTKKSDSSYNLIKTFSTNEHLYFLYEVKKV